MGTVYFLEMTVRDQVLQMPREERLIVMEALWESLIQDIEEMDSPAWHEIALTETAQRYASGQEVSVDWVEAKQRLRR